MGTAALIAMLTIGLAPAPAGAVDCLAGFTCLWRDKNYYTGTYTSRRITYSGYIRYLFYYTYPYTETRGDLSATSISNTGISDRSYFYKDVWCSGPVVSLATDTGDGDLTNSSGHINRSDFNDAIVSGGFRSYLNECAGRK